MSFYAQIATDLKTAIELLPPPLPFGSFSAPELGHATKWAAEALIARALYLFYSGYYKKEVLPLNDGEVSQQQDKKIGWMIVSQIGTRLDR